jgi:hypothetical protein
MMFGKLIQKIEDYGPFAMFATVAAVTSFFVLLAVLTEGWILAIIPPIGLGVIISAWIDVRRDERKLRDKEEQQ